MGVYPIAKAYYGFRVPMAYARGVSSVQRLLEQCGVQTISEMGEGIALFGDGGGVNVMLYQASICTWRGPWYDDPEPRAHSWPRLPPRCRCRRQHHKSTTRSSAGRLFWVSTRPSSALGRWGLSTTATT
ncbi:hypothetical protein pclt_cds_244 [Pandoravirus celtis]|uniref:Uncharacterized protein n=1 Tax=Pandoravirus celtis TaxID=2568002 RepID=A0A4D6EHA3_9VIRU|nr:hypothetical protein pclt_cds_244 [Pandoravirus celtis]